jgi:hypothetical protein
VVQVLDAESHGNVDIATIIIIRIGLYPEFRIGLTKRPDKCIFTAYWIYFGILDFKAALSGPFLGQILGIEIDTDLGI